MRGLRAAFRAEARDLLLHPLAWIGAISTAAAAWFFGGREPVKNGYVVYGGAALAGARVAGFFLLALGAAAIAGERTQGTVRWLLPRPVNRSAVVLGKAGAVALLSIALLSVCLLAARLVAAPHGFGDIVQETGGFHFVEEAEVPPEFRAATLDRRMAQASLLLVPALLTAGGFGLLFSSFVRSSSAAVIAAIAAVLPLNYLPEIVGAGGAMGAWFPFRAAETYLGHLQEFGRGLSTARWPALPLGAALGGAAGALGLPVLAALLFSRLDLTD